MKLGEAIYNPEGEAPDMEPGDEGPDPQDPDAKKPSDDDVVDAEYEELDENGKKRA